ncbi:hypothetical protein ABPG75_009437 [Micractinium tetrahymenae]
MRKDLSFASPELEREFFELQTQRNSWLEAQFHYARALTWLAVLLRTLATREWAACVVVALGMITTLLPAFADRLPRKEYLRWRHPLRVADNVLQVALGCYTHRHIYPNPKSGPPSTFQMAIVLLTGNGVAWQLFCSLFGSLIFRVALPQQAALTIILLLYNGQLCQRNAAIQHAYARLAAAAALPRARLPALLRSVAQHMQHLVHFSPDMRSCGAAVLAAPAGAAEAVRMACLCATQAAAAPEANTGFAGLLVQSAGGMASPADIGEELCQQYQPASLLLLGFLLPTWVIWRSELRLRRRFLAHKAAALGEHPDLPPSMQPDCIDYASFAVPAVAAMYWFVVAGGAHSE